MAKRGAHAPPFLRSAPEGIKTIEEVYGANNLAHTEDWMVDTVGDKIGVRIITAAPEVDGILDSVKELTDRGVVFSIGHRYLVQLSFICTSLLNHMQYRNHRHRHQCSPPRRKTDHPSFQRHAAITPSRPVYHRLARRVASSHLPVQPNR